MLSDCILPVYPTYRIEPPFSKLSITRFGDLLSLTAGHVVANAKYHSASSSSVGRDMLLITNKQRATGSSFGQPSLPKIQDP
jgi:hypothetical protein